MQIVILINNFINHAQIEPLLEYHRAKEQNILLVKHSQLYFKQRMIYARKCLAVKSRETRNNVLLSPSLVIDLSLEIDNPNLAKNLKFFWANAQQVFYQKQTETELSLPLQQLCRLKEKSHCICYTDNNSQPAIKIIEQSIEINSDNNKLSAFNSLGLLEQAITEYFANNNFFSQFEWPRDEGVSNHQSMIFFIQFDIQKKHADFQFSISSIKVLNYQELIFYNREFVFEYLDAVFQYRLNRYIELVKFRQYIAPLCEQHDIEFEPSYARTFVLSKDNKIGLHRGYFGGVNPIDMIEIVKDKHKTNVFLLQQGIKVNQSIEFALAELDNDEAIENLHLNYPLVLKPTNKKEGYGVVTNIKTPEKMRYSVKKLLKLGDIDPVIVEEFFTGVTYRVLVIGGVVIAVLKFIPASIKGDGKTSIRDLITAKNLISRSRIRVNDALVLSIANDGYDWDSILAEGENYILSHNSHASMGGQATNVTDIFKNDYKIIAEQVAKSLELNHTGIDMIVNRDGDYRVLEVNCAPALSTHLYPRYGTAIDTYSKVLECLCNKTDLEREDNRYLTELVKYHR